MFGLPRRPVRNLFDFSDRVRAALARARDEARRLRHDYVGTEHLLLGLLHDAQVRELLGRLGASPEEIRAEVEGAVPPGTSTRKGDLPYTSRAKRVLEMTMTEAREQGATEIGTRTLLIGIIREERGVAGRVLAAFRVTADRVRAEQAAGPAGFVPRIDDASDLSIYEQLVAQVKEAAATGRVLPGERLPSVRALADELDIAPGTVARAYAELERLGVVVTEGARGTRIAEPPRPGRSESASPENLAGLLRPVVVAAYHLGATAADLRDALERAMSGIIGDDRDGPDAAAA